MSSLSPDTNVKFTTREFFAIVIFVIIAAFTAGGAWVKIAIHEDNGHPHYLRQLNEVNKDLNELKNRLIRIETKLEILRGNQCLPLE